MTVLMGFVGFGLFFAQAQSGTYNVALAAKHYSVPVIVCCALYKLTTRFPCTYDKDEFADLASPHDTLDFSEGGSSLWPDIELTIALFREYAADYRLACAAGCMANVEVRSPIYDYVPPQLISLYITNGYALSWRC
jgi:translation initiation factor eIF-2B subunit beta